MKTVNSYKMRLYKICFFVFLAGIYLDSVSAEPVELWNNITGGNLNDSGLSVAVDANNNIIVAGYADSFSAGGSDVWTIKYGPDGNMLWNKTAGGNLNDSGSGVAVDANSNIIVTGYTNSFGAGGSDVWTIKYGPDGNMLWNKTFGGSLEDAGFGVAVDKNNNIMVTGYTNSFGAGGGDLLTIKYDSNGSMLWNKTEGGSSSDLGRGVAVDSDNNIIVAGYTKSFGSGGDVWMLKYNSNGNITLFSKTFGGSSDDAGFGVAVDSDNNIIVAGYTESFGSGGRDAWTIKCNPNGDFMWNKTAGGILNDSCLEIAVDSNNNIITAGYSESSGSGVEGMLIIKYNSGRNMLWNKTAGGILNGLFSGAAVDKNNNIIVAGYTDSSGSGGSDIITMKYSSCDRYCSSCSNCTAEINNAYERETVCLNQNIVNQSATCINNPDGFNNKIFDCQRNTIDGKRNDDTYGIYLKEKSGNTIKNCIIADFYNGIYLKSSSNNLISDNTLTFNKEDGIYLNTPFSEPASQYNTISNNNASYNGNNGIHLSDSSRNTLTNNNASYNGANGIYLVSGPPSGDCSNNILSKNTAENNNYSGFYFYFYATGTFNTVSNNRVCYNNLSAGSYDIINVGGNPGENNICDKTNNWNDLGITGCAVKCTVRPGDSNGDGVINIFDVIWAEKIAVGLPGPYAGKADANCDGTVNIFDVIWIEKLAVGLPGKC